MSNAERIKYWIQLASIFLGPRIARIVFFSDLHATRFILGFAEFIWGVTLLLPGDTFERPTYHVMAHVMHEHCWALAFLVTATIQWSILITGRYHDKFSIVFAGYNTVFWVFVVVSMYVSVSPVPAAISGETALAIAAGWIFARSGFSIEGRRTTDYGQ